MSKLDFLLILSRPPMSGNTSREALDGALANAALDRPTGIVILEPGKDWLHQPKTHARSDPAPPPHPNRLISMARIYDVRVMTTFEIDLPFENQVIPSDELTSLLRTSTYTEVY